MELIRPIVKVGNSAGVVLPREWLYGKAKIILIEKSLQPEKEVFDVLKEYLRDVVALAIVGSYARGEQTAESDVDILAITKNVGKRISYGRYEIIMIPLDKIEETLRGNALPLIPMFREAKPIINKALFDNYKNEKVTSGNLRWHIETTRSALNVVRKILDLLEEDEPCVSDGIMYSLILRLREWYIVEHLLHETHTRKKEFMRLVKHVSGSYEPYYSYLRSKNKLKDEKKTSVGSALKIYDYLSKKIEEQKKWIRKKG